MVVPFELLTKEGQVSKGEIEQEKIVWPYRLAVPILYALGLYVFVKRALYQFFGGKDSKPNTHLWFIDGASINSRRIKDGAATWRALDAVYNFNGVGEGDGWIARKLDKYWLNIWNAQAVRNRLKIVKRELTLAILDIAKRKGRTVRILSLAAGSGQGVIEVISRMAKVGIKCNVLLADFDDSALAHAHFLAEKHGVSDSIITKKVDLVIKGGITPFDQWLGDFKPDIIEMCGLIDYLRDKRIVQMVNEIHNYLQPGGWFMTCHIHPNRESYFLLYQENWWMLYRTREQLKQLVIDGGFNPPRLETEFHRIHTVAIVQKQ